MAELQVKCVKKNVEDDITHIGGDEFLYTSEEAIGYIETGVYTFYTLIAGRRAEVRVIHDSRVAGGKYLRTDPDITTSNNLDDLPMCS